MPKLNVDLSKAVFHHFAVFQFHPQSLSMILVMVAVAQLYHRLSMMLALVVVRLLEPLRSVEWVPMKELDSEPVKAFAAPHLLPAVVPRPKPANLPRSMSAVALEPRLATVPSSEASPPLSRIPLHLKWSPPDHLPSLPSSDRRRRNWPFLRAASGYAPKAADWRRFPSDIRGRRSGKLGPSEPRTNDAVLTEHRRRSALRSRRRNPQPRDEIPIGR